jgi:YegS/Rv2252/BmrU family lipid kinase
MARHILLIFNPTAAASRDQSARLDRVVHRLVGLGHRVEKRPSQASGQAVQIARDATGFDVVVAVGGDGTVNEVASGLMLQGSELPLLAIAPFGTGNDIAKLVGTPDDDAFIGSIERWKEHRLDRLQVEFQGSHGVEHRAAILFAAVGFASELLRKTTPRVKRWFGPKMCYSVGFFRALMTYRTPMVRARSGVLDVREPMLVAYAANAPHAGGGMMQLAPKASMEDGLMNVSLVRQTSRWEATSQFPRLLKGTHIGHPKVRYFTGTQLELEADVPLDVSIDGDIVGKTPMNVRMQPRSFRVLMGKNS